jgi:tRNA(fMet)-specific endonuclease VapC
LRAFLQKPNVKVLFADEGTVAQYVAVYRRLRTSGKMIPTNDHWIAALVLQHDLVLLTRDAHFDQLPEIRRR